MTADVAAVAPAPQPTPRLEIPCSLHHDECRAEIVGQRAVPPDSTGDGFEPARTTVHEHSSLIDAHVLDADALVYRTPLVNLAMLSLARERVEIDIDYQAQRRPTDLAPAPTAVWQTQRDEVPFASRGSVDNYDPGRYRSAHSRVCCEWRPVVPHQTPASAAPRASARRTHPKRDGRRASVVSAFMEGEGALLAVRY